ncbi:hypothetical protein HG530_010936 [Fusarium avenaceum]|nr:hypothetical protein HG530_010936 [Fusarium avenaceum]
MEVSSTEHSMARPASSVDTIPATQYVKGLTRYMNIQKPGRAVGDWRTPQKVKLMRTRRVTIADAVRASGKAAMVICAKELAVVETGEHENAGKNLVRYLDENVRDHESLPRVRLAGSLSDFVQVTLGDEMWLDLDNGEDGDDHEYREQDVLHSRKGRVSLEEREADKETSDSAKNKLGHDIGRHSPVLLEDSNSDLSQLRGEWHSELGVAGCVVLGSGGRHDRMDPFNFGFDSSAFLTALPDRMPIFSLGAHSVVDDLKHPLSRVLVISTGSGTFLLEVIEKSTAGLMNGAEDSLSGICKLAEEGDDGPRTLGVETTAGIKRPAVNKHVSSDDTHSGPLSQYIEKCCLASTTHAHEGSESTRLDPTGDVVQESTRLALDLNVIDDISPSKHIGLWFESSSSIFSFTILLRHTKLLVVHASINARLEMCGNVAALEDENLGLAGCLGVQLGGCEVDDHEGEKKREKNAEVAPDVRVVVSIVGLDESVSADCSLTGYSADC